MPSSPPIHPQIYQLLVEQAEDYALFVLDPQGRVATWNAGAERIKGYSAEEIIGRHFSAFYTTEAIESGWPDYELKMAAQVGRFEDEGWRLRKNGSRFWASVVITALRDTEGSLLGFSKITRDLSERKIHEEALRQSEERFRLLVEGVMDYAIYMLDPEGIISSWNAGAERIKGYRRDEVMGKHFSMFYTPEDLALEKPALELSTARRTGQAEDEGWRVRKDGKRFWARVVVSALHDANGQLRGFAKVTQDLSDRRHIQHLEKAAQNVSEFIATLAHELRNPLAPIRSAVQVMAKLGPSDAAYEAMLQMIDRQSAHLTRIVDDMIDIARISRGSLSIHRSIIAIAEVVRSSVEMALPLIEKNEHKLSIDVPSGALHVEGDLNRLTQLLTNLLNNAARYTPRGGRISVTARAEGGDAVVVVADTGRGIEPDMLERIFDMFVQGRTSLERVDSGLGIGLALARQLAELHGGSLKVHSEGPGRGSEFTFRIPLTSYPHVDAPAPEGPRESATPRRVLLVDDNIDAASTLDILLRSLGHDTRVATTGAAGLRIADEFHPDIVLLDIGLPDVDGYEVARRLRAATPERPLRIVALTGWGQAEDRARTKEAGFDLHLTKPIEMEDLHRALGASRNTPP